MDKKIGGFDPNPLVATGILVGIFYFFFIIPIQYLIALTHLEDPSERPEVIRKIFSRGITWIWIVLAIPVYSFFGYFLYLCATTFTYSPH